jgi:hypothetical protein
MTEINEVQSSGADLLNKIQHDLLKASLLCSDNGCAFFYGIRDKMQRGQLYYSNTNNLMPADLSMSMIALLQTNTDRTREHILYILRDLIRRLETSGPSKDLAA